jgi:hypothetical protein
LFH